jgi:hypothetical protein
MDAKSATEIVREQTMSDENDEYTGKDNPYNREHTKSAFCEELLECFVCEKIFFSRHPITIPTLKERDIHVCLTCCQTIVCCICGEPLTSEKALFIENLPEAGTGLLCPHCRDRVFLGLPPASKGLRQHVGTSVASVRAALRTFVRRILSVRIRFWVNKP